MLETKMGMPAYIGIGLPLVSYKSGIMIIGRLERCLITIANINFLNDVLLKMKRDKQIKITICLMRL